MDDRSILQFGTMLRKRRPGWRRAVGGSRRLSFLDVKVVEFLRGVWKSGVGFESTVEVEEDGCELRVEVEGDSSLLRTGDVIVVFVVVVFKDDPVEGKASIMRVE